MKKAKRKHDCQLNTCYDFQLNVFGLSKTINYHIQCDPGKEVTEIEAFVLITSELMTVWVKAC